MQLLRENDDFHETMRAKLEGILETNQFVNFSRCGTEKFYRTCRGCKAVVELDAQCNLKWCPRCQWRLVEKRKNVLKLWADTLEQPKHLILTERNWPVMTRKLLRDFARRLAKFRRSKCFKGVRGGCVSIEVTNEGNGWHVHSHWLLDVDWLDMSTVSQTWGKLAGQHYAICQVKDCRNKSYLQEVTKYVCDGSEMAKWPGEQLSEFVQAIKGRRFFFAFGSLFKKSKDIRNAIQAGKPPPAICECGCEDFIFETETAAVLADLRRNAGQLRGDYVEPRQRAPSTRGGRRHSEAPAGQLEMLEDRNAAASQNPFDGERNHHRRDSGIPRQK